MKMAEPFWYDYCKNVYILGLHITMYGTSRNNHTAERKEPV